MKKNIGKIIILLLVIIIIGAAAVFAVKKSKSIHKKIPER